MENAARRAAVMLTMKGTSPAASSPATMLHWHGRCSGTKLPARRHRRTWDRSTLALIESEFACKLAIIEATARGPERSARIAALRQERDAKLTAERTRQRCDTRATRKTADRTAIQPSPMRPKAECRRLRQTGRLTLR